MSAGIDTTTFEAIVRQAQRAPTAHNTQPALFRLNNPREIAILGDARRALSVSDPSRRDYLMGLGAVAEGVRLALAERAIAARIESMSNTGDAPVSGDHRCVARVLIDGACEPDPLGSQVAHRRSYRGSFAKLSAERANAARQRLDDIPGAVLVTDQLTIAALTNHYEAANLSSLRDPAFVGELWHWLRLNPHHANYDRDGLNADCMAMSGIERRLAGLVMRPAVLPRLLR
ncbi:MAG: hypothetical protein LBE59_01000, partial [Nevskiaceae bacterium]|nr:hypothetical protein [Nevskiaceae bacterium]